MAGRQMTGPGRTSQISQYLSLRCGHSKPSEPNPSWLSLPGSGAYDFRAVPSALTQAWDSDIRALTAKAVNSHRRG